jgi:hypothetical protein
MVQRLAITVGGIAATVVLTVGLVAAGFVPGSSPATLADPASAAGEDTATTAGDQIEPEIVYVKPAPKARTIVVERPAGRRSIAATRPVSRTRTVRIEREDREDREDRNDREDREDREDRKDRNDREGDDD